jgi:hypothetical protein
MLKIGKVYLYENKNYIYVHTKKKVGGRNIYSVSKVDINGELKKPIDVRFKRGKFKLIEDVSIRILVRIPQKNRQKLKWLKVVNDAQRKMVALKISGCRETKRELRKEIGKLAVASIYFQNSESGDCFNLRDFAKELNFNTYTTLYRWAENYLRSIYTEDRYKNAIKSAADRTIYQAYNNKMKYWSGLYGFNKNINKMLDRDLKAYMKEMRERAI